MHPNMLTGNTTLIAPGGVELVLFTFFDHGGNKRVGNHHLGCGDTYDWEETGRSPSPAPVAAHLTSVAVPLSFVSASHTITLLTFLTWRTNNQQPPSACPQTAVWKHLVQNLILPPTNRFVLVTLLRWWPVFRFSVPPNAKRFVVDNTKFCTKQALRANVKSIKSK